MSSLFVVDKLKRNQPGTRGPLFYLVESWHVECNTEEELNALSDLCKTLSSQSERFKYEIGKDKSLEVKTFSAMKNMLETRIGK
jgi:hypothetical protein